LHGLFDTFSELNRMREHWREVEPTPEARTHATAWVPSLDVFAQGDDLVLRCELAGVGRDDVEVSLAGDRLTIWGERKDDPRDSGDVVYFVRERRYGPFRRTVNLPQGIDRERIRASFENGLLEITIDGGVAPDDHQTIEIASRAAGQVELDVRSGT
jgi:HSP20 family protein